MDFVAILEEGRRDFLEATSHVSAEQALLTPGAQQWSVLQIIEHVVTVEERFLGRLASATEVTTPADPDRELRLFTMMRSRLTKVEAPEAVRPAGRFTTLVAALSGFQASRDRSVALVKEAGATLHSRSAKHFRFGDLLGPEWIHLIDAHARRHADQIRETAEVVGRAPEVQRKRPSAKDTTAFRRDRPDLPAKFDAAEAGAGSWVSGELVSIQEAHVMDVDARDLRVGSLYLEGCVLERVRLAGGQFGSAIWKDVRLVGCDLGNVRAHRMALTRVELIDCRLTGISSAALEWQDVLIQNGDAGYAQLSGGTFRNCEFAVCNWQDADLQNGDLAGCVFRSCQLRRADLRGAKLQDTDLRRSEVEGLLVNMTDLRGAIVDPTQAMVLAEVLGLQIR